MATDRTAYRSRLAEGQCYRSRLLFQSSRMRLRRSSIADYSTPPAIRRPSRFILCRAGCCIFVTPFLRESDMLMRAEGDCMFDVYLNEKRDRLLVVAKGQPIPIIGNSGRWRKKKGAVAVSDEIKLALQRDGFYWRRRAEDRGSNSLPSKPTSPVAAKATFSKRYRELSSGGAAE
jgi:hypothetical protein